MDGVDKGVDLPSWLLVHSSVHASRPLFLSTPSTLSTNVASLLILPWTVTRNRCHTDPPMSDFREMTDLAAERLGGAVVYANDEFFAGKENLLKPEAPVWKEHEYTDRGKWMDGWETRRRRTPGHDTCIIRLGVPGIVKGAVVDTAFFRGNYPESCSIEGCRAPANADVEALLSSELEWSQLLSKSPLQGNHENEFGIDHPHAFTHIRFNIFPDGGVARLRLHGEVVPEWRTAGGLGGEIDLAAIEHGGEVLTCSDMFFGPKHNLIMPGRGFNMSDGWETRRRRGPGHDWVVVKLGVEGTVTRIELDTNHFKGNYPDTASIDGARIESDEPDDLAAAEWVELLGRTRLQAHTRHFFADELADCGPLTHLRLNVFPDGGVSRLRAHGQPSPPAVEREVVRRINSLPRAREELLACCGSTEWARRVEEARPFGDWGELVETADSIWSNLSPEDWLEAFRAHPRIGERAHGSSTAARWSGGEQAGVDKAAQNTLEELAAGNSRYEERFGHVFLICATGRTAEEMLALLRERMGNDPETELRVAAEEQRKITQIRLRKLVT